MPRHVLVPRFYCTHDRAVIDSTNPDDAATWLDTVYSNKTLVTQITPTDVTSSGTMPGLIAKMLTATRINSGDNVLHVGTGTGYLAQAAPGARIVAPLATGLIALEITGLDHASGRFLTPGGFFMPLRETHQRDQPTPPSHGIRRDPRPTELGPRQTFYEDHLRFLLTISLPDVATAQHGPMWDDLILYDSAGSTARLDRTESGTFLVTETGPRALWNEVEHLHHQWQTWGQPHRERYGLTITAENQTIWLDEPHDTPTWPLPNDDFTC